MRPLRILSGKGVDFHGVLSLFFLVAYCFISANRPESFGVDTERYVDIFKFSMHDYGLNRDLEYGFIFFTKLVSLSDSHVLYFFLISFFIFSLSVNLGGSLLGWRLALLIYAFFLSPFFYGHTVNVLRQGMSFALLLYFITARDLSFRRALICFFLAGSFHVAGYLYAFLAYVARRSGFRFSLLVWFFGLFVGVLLSGDSFLGGVVAPYLKDDYYSGYFESGVGDYKTGLRLDFILFSIALGVFGFLFSRCVARSVEREKREFIFRSYLISNGVSLVFLQFPYSDRWLNWSWAFAPLFFYWFFIYVADRWGRGVLLATLPFVSFVAVLLNYFAISAVVI